MSKMTFSLTISLKKCREERMESKLDFGGPAQLSMIMFVFNITMSDISLAILHMLFLKSKRESLISHKSWHNWALQV